MKIYLYVFIVLVCNQIYGQSYWEIPKEKPKFYLDEENYYDDWIGQLNGYRLNLENKDRHWEQKQYDRYNKFITYFKILTDRPSDILLIFLEAYEIDKHWFCAEYKYAMNNYKFNYSHKYYATEIKMMNTLCNCLKDTYNNDLIAVLQKIDENDQKYRGNGKSLTLMQQLGEWEKQLELDSINLIKVEEIIEQYGYPNRDLAGIKHEEIAFYVIQHSNPIAMEKYLPIIKKEVEQKRLTASAYPLLYDRLQIERGLSQKFGTQYYYDNNDKMQFYQIEEEDKVNDYRKLYNLKILDAFD
jgi:hypothetical protein